MSRICPHPEKTAHRTKAAALKARSSLETARGIDLALKPYPCGDHWHLGHSRKLSKLERRVRRAMRRRDKPS